MAYYVGVDLGATNVRSVVADDEGTVLGQSRDRTPRGPTGIAVTEAVLGVVREACDEAGIDPSEAVAAGIGAIGPLDLAEGAVENPANLPDTIDRIPLTGPISVLLDTDEVYLHNDTNAGVIGERFHSDRNPDDMVYLTISSGIGAGVCVDGHIIDGWDGNAGEVGHMTLDPHGFMTCGCGHDGHWEGYCSGNNIPKYARELHEEDPVETALPVENPTFSAVDVFEHAGKDDFADHVISQLGHWNAMGVANIVHAYAPLIIYVGGAVALNNPDLVLDPIREQMSNMVMSNIPEIQLTTLGDEVVVEGALASAMTAGTGDRSRL
ncbi:ROK family protein [Haloferax mediterranei ATCC 33500]|uniref:Glucokinase n=1 Tax=Haloferax mediterranei (strain ATCC 33500 / DSM 1411 / JCM 8866 / NBRC 14739 / NCIMB 2177 / R-4) TaxID=523841 RepID=I3R1J6_HALMT|nr:ROK family protein [Haloferax mediterranei]AFK18106.2 glucokinase [Haloferax mediterranei ATCC 33500]AHZ22486.1 glucokinase [Haloferax mediterranei ATCC 33500]EMA02621.1 glucokinase [Haloferax mediterranei ATCC 33500]MDX5988196.1 ROK family protein [Haloferax mediterranei ATCC 33500]QCQ76590.1 ROK family protein [Haloferax mediterranei ATCC 33500]